MKRACLLLLIAIVFSLVSFPGQVLADEMIRDEQYLITDSNGQLAVVLADMSQDCAQSTVKAHFETMKWLRGEGGAEKLNELKQLAECASKDVWREWTVTVNSDRSLSVTSYY